MGFFGPLAVPLGISRANDATIDSPPVEGEAMLSLGILLQDGYNGQVIMDLAPRATGAKFSSGDHGFASFSCFVPLDLIDSFRLYGKDGTKTIKVANQYGLGWQGVLEDLEITDEGIALTAFGPWRALTHNKYTALWTVSRVDAWRTVQDGELASGPAPAKFEFNQEGQLYTALKKGEVYANNDESGAWVLQFPHGTSRKVYYVEFDYDYTLPTNWKHVTQTWDEGFTGSSLEDTITGDGANHTGTKTITVAGSNKELVIFQTFNSTGSPYTNSGESDAWYFRATNIRVTSSATPIEPSDIMADLVALAGSNTGPQMSSSTTLLEDSGLELFDEVYEDMTPADIIDYLVSLGNATGERMEAGFYEDQTLYYRAKGSAGHEWFVDAASVRINRSIEGMYNRVYAILQDASGRKLRGTAAVDEFSRSRFNVTRTWGVPTNTTDSTQANYIRDTFLADNANPRPKSAVVFNEVYDAAGVRYPNWVVRAGDTITIRNLPAMLSSDIDRIRSFRVKATEYDMDNDALSVTPEDDLPTLDVILAQQSEGLRKLAVR